MDITDIMLLKQQQQQQKSKVKIGTTQITDLSISDSITYPVINKSNCNVSGQDESAMELAMDSVST